ncbi:uncharacterized protein C8A04DRAFT_35093 [Dichotomopilus funicola]|uniref:Zeta toxin domain-containing protein n=1 Tax=Dichotomopilus funicola TaxID=1934379 RepID=A0AAN6ZP06_9PEZI|nr:hypothetical protein C8A04DRAFT_35093 [Dichotomopilus funicola]
MEDTTRPTRPPLGPGNDSDNQDETTRLLASWQIDEQTHARILETEIVPVELGPFLKEGGQTGQRPLVIFVIGQTGAGKSVFTPCLLEALREEDDGGNSREKGEQKQRSVLHLIADTYKTYHPFYHAALAHDQGRATTASSAYASGTILSTSTSTNTNPTNPETHSPNTTTTPTPTPKKPLASRLAGPSAARWLREICERAAALHVPRVVIELASRLASGVFSLHGYTVRVAVLAVPTPLSRLGVLEQQQEQQQQQHQHKMPPRLTPRVVHDESVAGVREAVAWVDAGMDAVDGGSFVADRVVVLRRGGGVVHERESDRVRQVEEEGEKTEKPDSAGRALEREQARPLSRADRKTAAADIAMLRALGGPGVDKEVDDIEGLLEELGEETETETEAKMFDAAAFVSMRES